ncbi:MAG: hypothetical protein Q4D71_08545 [Oscillospiraceae bacterium]|nr:hypothetical protein [Oscillospiraceae bacterium]
MLKKTTFKLTLLMSALVCLVINMTPVHAYADESTVGIAGDVYEFGEKDHYEFESTKGASGTSADNTYGEFFISGNITPDSSVEGIPSFLVSTGNVSVTYSYSDSLLTAADEEWHLV